MCKIFQSRLERWDIVDTSVRTAKTPYQSVLIKLLTHKSMTASVDCSPWYKLIRHSPRAVVSTHATEFFARLWMIAMLAEIPSKINYSIQLNKLPKLCLSDDGFFYELHEERLLLVRGFGSTNHQYNNKDTFFLSFLCWGHLMLSDHRWPWIFSAPEEL